MATQWDMTVPRGCTDPITYPITLNGVPDTLAGFSDLRWYAKVNDRDPDGPPGLIKTYANAGGVTVSGTNVVINLVASDTAAPALSPNPGTLVLYLDLVLFFANGNKYSLFRLPDGTPQTPTLTLYQTIGLALS